MNEATSVRLFIFFGGAKRVVLRLVVMVLTKLHLHLVESQIFQRLHCHVICQFQEQQITLEMFVYCIPNGTFRHFYSSQPQTDWRKIKR